MLNIHLDDTPHGTQRIWLHNLDQLTTEQSAHLTHVTRLLKMASCWGGADKTERASDGYSITALSYELRPEDASHVYPTIKLMLKRLPLEFAEGHPMLETAA